MSKGATRLIQINTLAVLQIIRRVPFTILVSETLVQMLHLSL